MKKYLLPGMMATLMFAACTNEEIVSQQNEADAPEIDLSSRPVAGLVDLNFGPQTRATLDNDKSFNTLEWGDSENDNIGARLIDKVVAANKRIAYNRYGADNDNAWTNYLYKKVAGEKVWETEALLVEGNYMFYAPYDENARLRNPLVVNFPLHQTVNIEDEGVAGVDANTSAIKQFYSNDYKEPYDKNYTFALGYAFISADDDLTAIEPTMSHLYAYPEFTLKNAYTEYNGKYNATHEDKEAKAITIDKIYVSASNIKATYKANHTGFIAALHDEHADSVWYEGRNKRTEEGVDAGTWRNNINRLKNARTSQILTGQGNATEIEIDFEPNLTIEKNGEFSFHLILPAEQYADLKIARVVLEGDKAFYKNWDYTADDVNFEAGVKSFVPFAYTNEAETNDKLTYAPQMRYAVEEYNFPTSGGASLKASAGDLATFTLAGYIGDYKAPKLGIKYLTGEGDESLETYLAGLKDNTTKTVEESDNTFKLYTWTEEDANAGLVDRKYVGYAQLKLTQDLLELVEEYLDGGTIKFTSPMLVEGAFDSNEQLLQTGALMQIDNKDISLTNVTVNGGAEFSGKTRLDVVTIAGDARFNNEVSLNNVTVTGLAKFAGNVANFTYKEGGATKTKDSNARAANVEFITGGKGSLNANVSDKVTFNGGDVTISGRANSATVIKGTVTVKGELGATTVYNGATVKLDKQDHVGVITVGKVDDDDDFSDAGNLEILKDQKNAIVALTTGVVTNGKNIKLASWTAGTLKNNGTIEGSIDVPAGAEYKHGTNAVATINEVKGAVLNEDGSVEKAAAKVVNSGELEVATNNGLIETDGALTYTTVNAGEGEIDNTSLGVVYNNADQTVYYNTGAFENDEKWLEIEASTQNAINKLVVTGLWKVTAATAVPATYEVVEFQSDLNVTDATLTFAPTTEVIIGERSEWKGRTIEKSIVDGMKCVKENAAWNVKYLTLGVNYQVNALKNGGTLKLTSNRTFQNVYTLTEDLVLDLNKFTLNFAPGVAPANTAHFTVNGATLTVKNGTFEAEGTHSLIEVKDDSKLVVASNATLKSTAVGGTCVLLKGDDIEAELQGTYESKGSTIMTNGNFSDVEFSIENATVTSTDALAMYLPANGTYSLKNVKATGNWSAVEMRGDGQLSINGGKFVSTATGTTPTVTPNGNGATVYGAAVAVSPHKDRDIEVVISGQPTFQGIAAFWEGQTVADTKGRTTVNPFLMNEDSEGDIYLDGEKLSEDEAEDYKAAN